jgi:hypothetical protein
VFIPIRVIYHQDVDRAVVYVSRLTRSFCFDILEPNSWTRQADTLITSLRCSVVSRLNEQARQVAFPRSGQRWKDDLAAYVKGLIPAMAGTYLPERSFRLATWLDDPASSFHLLRRLPLGP